MAGDSRRNLVNLKLEPFEDRVVPANLLPKAPLAATADLTHDGQLDFAVSAGSFLFSVNGATSQLIHSMRSPVAQGRISALALADVNGDSQADLIIWERVRGKFRVRIVNGTDLVGGASWSTGTNPATQLTQMPTTSSDGSGGGGSGAGSVGAPTAVFGNSGPVSEGGSASVSFTQVQNPAGTGVTYSYDFDNNGQFEITGSANASANVPSNMLADGPRTLTVRGRVTDANGLFTDYTTQVQVNNVKPTPNAGGPY